MVERFLRSADVVAWATSLRFAHLWIVAPRRIRPDAADLARGRDVLTSDLRLLERLDRLFADTFDVALCNDQ